MLTNVWAVRTQYPSSADPQTSIPQPAGGRRQALADAPPPTRVFRDRALGVWRYQTAAKATAPRSIVPSATAASAGAPGRAGDWARARISSAWRSLAVANHSTTPTTTPTIRAAHGATERTTSKPAMRPARPVRCQAKRVRSGWRPGSKSSLTLAARPPESSGR